MKKLFLILFTSLLICNCSYNLYVFQATPKDMEELKKEIATREPQSSTGAIGDVSKAPNRNFTDVHNSGNILYLTIDTQTPKVISTTASVPVTVTPIP